MIFRNIVRLLIMKFSHLLTAAISFSSIILAACAPNATSYFLPDVDGGIVVTGKCVPTKSRIKFSIENLQVDANAFLTRRTNQLTVVLSLMPPPGQSIYFLSEQFNIKDLEKGNTLPGVSVFALRSDRATSPSTPFPEEASKFSPLGFNFNVYISVPYADNESFELTSPPIFIDGTKIEFPPIQFNRKVWVGISPLNC